MQGANHSTGEISVPLIAQWVKDQLLAGRLDAKDKDMDQEVKWEGYEEEKLEGPKPIVSPKDYETLEISKGQEFFIRKGMSPKKKMKYIVLL